MSVTVAEVETAVETYADSGKGRLRLLFGWVVEQIATLYARMQERKKEPRGVYVIMNDHLLRDIGLRRSDLKREFRAPHRSGGKHDCRRDY